MERFDRQILLFGEEGQKKIAAVHVAIVGLGGLGSHVAQQLAYLGVERFVLIDGDIVQKTNLNRLIGATVEDADAKRLKVDVSERTIKAIQPAAVEKFLPRLSPAAPATASATPSLSLVALTMMELASP